VIGVQLGLALRGPRAGDHARGLERTAVVAAEREPRRACEPVLDEVVAQHGGDRHLAPARLGLRFDRADLRVPRALG
jgi:hypothetical protein